MEIEIQYFKIMGHNKGISKMEIYNNVALFLPSQAAPRGK